MPAFYCLVGVIIGALITWYARELEIERALDTKGITRKEHQRLKKDVEALELEVEALAQRFAQALNR